MFRLKKDIIYLQFIYRSDVHCNNRTDTAKSHAALQN
jgi:hypothetical protein